MWQTWLSVSICHLEIWYCVSSQICKKKMKINYYFIFQLKIVLHIVIVFPDWNEWKRNIQFNFSILSSKITMVKCSVRTLSSMFYTSCRKSLLFEGIDFWILVISSWKQFNWHFISNQMALLSIAIIINYFWPPLCNISKVPKKIFPTI